MAPKPKQSANSHEPGPQEIIEQLRAENASLKAQLSAGLSSGGVSIAPAGIDINTPYQQLIQNSESGYALQQAILDDDGNVIDFRYLDFNPSFCRITHCTPEQLRTLTYRQLLPDAPDDWITNLGRVAMNGEQLIKEFYVKASGSWSESMAIPTVKGQYVSIIHDTTVRMIAEIYIHIKMAIGVIFQNDSTQTEDFINLCTLIAENLNYPVCFLAERESPQHPYYLLGSYGVQMHHRALNGEPQWEFFSRQPDSAYGDFPMDFPTNGLLIKGVRPVSYHLQKYTLPGGRDGMFVLVDEEPRSNYGPIVELFTQIVSDYEKTFTAYLTRQALRESEEKYRNFFENTGAIMMVMDPENGRIINTNAAACEFYGYTCEQLIGMNISQINIAGPTEIKKALLKASSGGHPIFQFKHRLANGDIRDVHVFSSPIYFQGKLFLYSIIQDITDQILAQQSLRENEDRFRKLVELAVDGIAVMDLTGKVIFCNSRMQQMRGFPTADEMIGAAADTFFAPEESSRIIEHLSKTVTEGYHRVEQVQMLRYDNTQFEAEIQAVLLRDPAGRPQGIVGYAHDISDRVRQEQIIAKSEDYFRTISTLTSDDVFTINRKDDGSLFAETKLGTIYRLSGYSPEEVDAHGGWASIFDPKEYAEAISVFRRLFESPGTESHDVHLVNRTGEERIIHITAQSVVDESTGSVIRIVGAISDVTEKVKAEIAVAKSEQLFRTVFESGAAGMAILNPDGLHQRVNPAYCAMLNYQPEALSELSFLDLLSESDRSFLRPIFEEKAEQSIQQNAYEMLFSRSGGGEMWGLTRLSAVYDTHHVLQYYIVMINDITEQKLAAEEVRLNEARLIALNRLNNQADKSVEEMCRFALNEIINLTNSTTGYLGFLSQNDKVVSIQAWIDIGKTTHSTDAMPDRWIIANHPELSRAVKTRKAVNIDQAGVKRRMVKIGPFNLTRMITIPILDGERVVAIAMIANKSAPYTEADILQVTLLTTALWRIITRNKSVAALQESENRNRRMIETSFEGIIAINLDRKLTFINPRLAAILKYPTDNLLGRDLIEFIYDDDHELYFEKHQHRLHGISEKYEIRFKDSNGDPIWCLVSATPMRDDEGKVYGSFAMVTDISDRKAAEERLHKNEALMRNVISSVSVILLVIDRNGRFVLTEGRGLSAIGLAPGELNGKTIYDLLYNSPDTIQEVLHALEGETIHTDMNINSHTFDTWLSPISDDSGALIGTICVATDISGQRQAEAAIRLSEEKYNQIFKTCPVSMSLSDYQTAKLVDVNDVFLYTYEYTAPEVIGKSASDLNIWVNENERSEIVYAINHGHPVDHREVQTRAKSGKIVTVLFSADKIRVGDKEYLLSVSYDITYRKEMENELHKSRQMLQTILDTIPQRIFWKDLNSQFLGANKQFLRDLGKEKVEDIVGKTDYDISPYDMARIYEQTDKQVIENNDVLYNFEHQQMIPGPKFLWVNTNKAPLHDIQGNVVGVLGSYEDITEMREAQNRLRESEERFRNLAMHAPVGIYEKNARHQTLFVNQRLLDLVGTASSDETPTAWMEGIAPQDIDAVSQAWEAAISNNQIFYAEYRRIRPDGSIVWLADHEKPIIDGEGQVTGYLGTLTDITQIKSAEEEVRHSLSLHQATLESTTDGLLVITLNGFVSSYNQKFLEMWKFSENDMVGMSHQDFLKKVSPRITSASAFSAKHRQVNDGKIERSFQVLRCLDGRIIEESSTPQSLDDQIVGRVWSYRDVTARYLADEKLRQNNAEMQEMIRRLTALRNIDTAITGHSTFDELVKEILPNIIHSLDVDAVSILLPTADGTHLVVSGYQIKDETLAHPPEILMINVQGCFAGRAYRDQQTITINNLAELNDRPRLAVLDSFNAYAAVPLIAKSEVKGVMEVFRKESIPEKESWSEFLQSLAMQAAIAIDNADLFTKMEKTNQELLQAYEATIEGWARALELRDKETHGHSQRVIDLTLDLARELGLSQNELIQLKRGVFLHDIGKMAVPDSILLKPGSLTPDEWIIMKQHPQFAYEMLSGIPYLSTALDVPYCHHEKWDGSGYPRGLSGEDIPISARIFAVVDVWDALTSDRPYRAAWPEMQVMTYLSDQTGKHFDPNVVKTFLRLIHRRRR